MLDYFLEIGAREIEFAEISDSFNEISEKMGRSDLVYLPGGDTRLLIQRMKNAKIGGLLNEYRKVIIGNSAGALVLCKECILSVDEKDPEAKVTAGLGLVDFSVYVHYNSSIDGELKKLSKDRKIYAIPEKSALLCDHGDLSFLGSICLFNGSKKRSVGGHLDGTD
jgi:peptidase E